MDYEYNSMLKENHVFCGGVPESQPPTLLYTICVSECVLVLNLASNKLMVTATSILCS